MTTEESIFLFQIAVLTAVFWYVYYRMQKTVPEEEFEDNELEAIQQACRAIEMDMAFKAGLGKRKGDDKSAEREEVRKLLHGGAQ